MGASKGAKSPRTQEATQALPSAAEPWDHLRGADRFCVFKNSARLDGECVTSSSKLEAPTAQPLLEPVKVHSRCGQTPLQTFEMGFEA